MNPREIVRQAIEREERRRYYEPLRLRIIAEFREHDRELGRLADDGCPHFGGYAMIWVLNESA